MNNNLGRGELEWSAERWQLIDQAVHDEILANTVARKYLPIVLTEALTVPANVINRAALTIDEGATQPLVEIGVKFALTPEQYSHEAELGTAVALARAAAKTVGQVEEQLILQGDAPAVIKNLPQGAQVRGKFGKGLLGQATILPIKVAPVDPKNPGVYQTETFKGITKGIAELLKHGYSVRYSVEFEFAVFADTYAPLNGTASTTADLIKPLVENRFYAGNLPTQRGVLTSQAGNSMELVFALDATTAFLQVNTEVQYLFEVKERFALRVMDPEAIVVLQFT